MNAKQNGRIWKLVPEVALRGEYQEFETIEWIQSTLKQGDCFIDVGANVGQMTLEAAHLVGPSGHVIAIEPAPGNLEVLRKHVKANGFDDRVTVIAAAATRTDHETITIRVVGDDADAVGSGHHIKREAEPFSGGEQDVVVSSVSIDGICEKMGLHPAAIKVDVEGAEVEVLEGARATLKAESPKIRFGFHPFAFDDAEDATKKIAAILESERYKVPATVGGAWELAEYETQPIAIDGQNQRESAN